MGNNGEEIRSRNLPSAVEAASINDQLYAYPLTADNGYFLYYNKAYFTDEYVQSLDRMLKTAAQGGLGLHRADHGRVQRPGGTAEKRD